MSELRSPLEELREKYLTMRGLRETNDRAVAAGVPYRPTRDELRTFSQRWPGALAEIDRIAPTLLHQRIAELDAAIAGGEPPIWARAWILAHARLRGALAIKMWLRGRRTIDDDLLRDFASTRFPPESELYRARLGEIASPPKGRISELVLIDVAGELSLDPATMRALLMPRG